MTDRIKQLVARYPKGFHHDYVLPDGTHTRKTGPVNYPQCMVDAFAPLQGPWDGKHVLDIGTNSGWMARYAAERGADVLGIDTCQVVDVLEIAEAISAWKPTTATIRYGDFLTEPGQYDVVLFMGVLYHMPEPGLALPALRRLCKPGGTLIVETLIGRAVDLFVPPFRPFENSTTVRFMPTPGWVDVTFSAAGFTRVSGREWMPGSRYIAQFQMETANAS